MFTYYFLTPTVLFFLLAGCSRDAPEGTGKDDKPRTVQPNVRSTPTDGDYSEFRVDCNLSLVRDGETIVAKLVFKNASPSSFSIRQWTLLADGQMTWNAFEVARGVEEVPYTCKMVFHGPETEADMIPLDIGVPYSPRTTISDCYDFSAPGRYVVEYSATFWLPGNYPLHVKSNKAELVVP